MTYLGKRSVDDQDQSTRNDSNLKRNLVRLVKQDDILKQSIQTDGGGSASIEELNCSY